MKSLLVVLAFALLALSMSACGKTSKPHSSKSSQASYEATQTTGHRDPGDPEPEREESIKPDADKDNDIGAPGDDKRHPKFTHFGHAANASDRRAITSLVKRYYAVALAEDGAKACGMLVSSLAEAIPQDQGHAVVGLPYAQGPTCAIVLTLIFRHFRDRLALELPKLRIAAVRVLERHVLVLLNFGPHLPERELWAMRERDAWKLDSLLDNALL